MPEADRRLRKVAQLRKLWRAFREPQERLEDERLARGVLRDRPTFPHVAEPVTLYGPAVILAIVRQWWYAREFSAIVELGEHLDPTLFDEEPLIRIYFDEAQAALVQLQTQT